MKHPATTACAATECISGDLWTYTTCDGEGECKGGSSVPCSKKPRVRGRDEVLDRLPRRRHAQA